MTKKRYVNMWVHPDFKKKIKSMAGQQDCSVIDLTHQLAHESDEVEEKMRKTLKHINENWGRIL